MSRNFPDFPGLGIIFNGEDWTGPKKDSSMSRVNGPTVTSKTVAMFGYFGVSDV